MRTHTHTKKKGRNLYIGEFIQASVYALLHEGGIGLLPDSVTLGGWK